ncbi:Thermonuclease [Burkholderiales bacterium]|nr:Thermonuclease [Burkholderiales bacterium]
MLRARWASTTRALPRSSLDARRAVRAIALAAGTAVALAAAGAAFADFSGRVVAVTDGDTLTVLDGTRAVRVRLWGVDAPERGQPWSRRARDALAARAMHRDVRVETVGTDGYGRTLARVSVGGVDLAEAQLRDGMAWVFRRYTGDPALVALEEDARDARRGLWMQREPEAPWRYRERTAAARRGAWVASERRLASLPVHGARSLRAAAAALREDAAGGAGASGRSARARAHPPSALAT